MNNREVYLMGRINEESVNKARERILELWEADQSKEITLFICSSGGAGNPAIAFYEWVKLKNIPLVTVAIGEVSSAAIIIFLSGQKRKATQHSWFMVHPGGHLTYEIQRKVLRILAPPTLSRKYRVVADI